MSDYLILLYRLILPFIDIRRFLRAFPQYIEFFHDFRRYKKLQSSEIVRLKNLFPIINENVEQQPFDAHYFYQDIWALKQIRNTSPTQHIDVGSRLDFIGCLTAVTCVIYVDIRKLEICLENYEFKKGSILHLPFVDNSIESLSCLHVAEHIGLGRYGDELDPHGTRKACKELQRILKPGGTLLFSLPVGYYRVCFNAHRIHSVAQILEYFDQLNLQSLSGVDDNQEYHENVNVHFFDNCRYACGLFHFTK